MGANRQDVQRITNDLHEQRLVALETNPHQKLVQLVVRTDKGKQAFDSTMRLQARWINDRSDGLSIKDMQTLQRTIRALQQKLERSEAEERRELVDRRSGI